jgi:hypothetical protein
MIIDWQALAEKYNTYPAELAPDLLARTTSTNAQALRERASHVEVAEGALKQPLQHPLGLSCDYKSSRCPRAIPLYVVSPSSHHFDSRLRVPLVRTLATCILVSVTRRSPYSTGENDYMCATGPTQASEVLDRRFSRDSIAFVAAIRMQKRPEVRPAH